MTTIFWGIMTLPNGHKRAVVTTSEEAYNALETFYEGCTLEPFPDYCSVEDLKDFDEDILQT